MKMSAALLSSLSLALVLTGCLKPKAKDRSGSPEKASAEDEEEEIYEEDVEDEDDTSKRASLPSSEDAEKEEPNAGQGDEEDEEEEEKKEEECYKADATICQVELRILELVNKERAAPTKGGGFFGGGSSNPKQALQNGKKLGYIARLWSVQQGQANSISHAGFPNARQAQFRQEFGASARMGGENVAMFGGRSGGVEEVAQQFYQMWYTSSGHYQNMMGNFQAVGIGVAQVGGAWYATQIFGAE